ncbi:MAG: hypothetical protein U0575_13845 [Phycisphaerales bacterium]
MDIVGRATARADCSASSSDAQGRPDAGWLDVAVILAVGSGLLCLVAFGWWKAGARTIRFSTSVFQGPNDPRRDRGRDRHWSRSAAASFRSSTSFRLRQHHRWPPSRLLPLVVTAAILGKPVASAATAIDRRSP